MIFEQFIYIFDYFCTRHTSRSLTQLLGPSDLGVTSAGVVAEQRSGKPPRVKRAHANALEERDNVPTHRSTMHTDSPNGPYLYICIFTNRNDGLLG